MPDLSGITGLILVALILGGVFAIFRWGGAVRSKVGLGKWFSWEVNKGVPGGSGAPAPGQRGPAAASLPPPIPPADPQAKQLNLAMDRLADVGQALVKPIEEPDPAKAESLIRGWFSMVVRNLSLSLTSGRADTFRVALWADTETELTGLAYFQFESGAPSKTLNRDTSVAGHTLRTKEPYYCRDTEGDAIYRPNTPGRKHSYRSIYAQPLGRDDNNWGVITVDAREPNGFTDVDRAIIAAFGKLATAGASLWLVLEGEKEKTGSREHRW